MLWRIRSCAYLHNLNSVFCYLSNNFIWNAFTSRFRIISALHLTCFVCWLLLNVLCVPNQVSNPMECVHVFSWKCVKCHQKFLYLYSYISIHIEWLRDTDWKNEFNLDLCDRSQIHRMHSKYKKIPFIAEARIQYVT